MRPEHKYNEKPWDAIIIGGGFYGCSIAAFLAQERHWKVCLLESENVLMARASYNNQARVHNGYHYPRSFVTAYRSRTNLPRFLQEWPDAIRKDYTKLYAIARRNSKVTARQFTKFCREIGASVERADASLRAYFNSQLIEDVFVVEEYPFDTTILAEWAKSALQQAHVDVRYATKVLAIRQNSNHELVAELQTPICPREHIRTRRVLNCTYSGLNQLQGEFPAIQSQLKHEITEMALVQMPEFLQQLAVTVMDGPFFSMMPFPARQLHTLSHVRYTPHLSWMDQPGLDPYQRLRNYDKTSRFERMLRDVKRYMPSMEQALHVDSLFEVKTVLAQNEIDDGRPILFERHETLPGCWSVLGGKIDNIYDVLERIRHEIH